MEGAGARVDRCWQGREGEDRTSHWLRSRGRPQGSDKTRGMPGWEPKPDGVGAGEREPVTDLLEH